MKLGISLTSAAAVALALPAAADAENVPGAKWYETRQLILANSAPRETKTYNRRNAILNLPILWEAAVRLETDVDFIVGGESGTIRSGTVLPAVFFSKDGTGNDARMIFCEPRKSEERALESGFLGAMFGGRATRALLKGLSDSQKCLVDNDEDGQFDQMLLVGEGPGNHTFGDTIDPIAYEIEQDVQVSSEDDMVQIRLTSVKKRSLRFELAIKQQGNWRRFDRLSGNYPAERNTLIKWSQDVDFPIKASILGAEFEIVEHDHKADTVVIRWPEEAAQDVKATVPQAWRQVFRSY